MTVVLALLVAVLGSLAIEAYAAKEPISRRPSDLAIRLAVYALIAAFWFQFSWRPWLACTTCLATLLVGGMIDRLKREVIGEPLVFSDLALLHQVPRHPELYYSLPLSDARMASLILAGTGGVVLWYLAEPTALPDGWLAATSAIVALPAAFVGICYLGRVPFLRRWLAERCPEPSIRADVRRYGIYGAMLGYGWRRDAEQQARTAAREPAPIPRAAEADEIIVVVQLESFLDPVRLGGPPLPAMARIRAEAAQYGSLLVPTHGAYTMRSEHAVLTGRTRASLGFGQFDPYLAQGGEEPTSLARLARAAGFATTFVHPYHRDFFDRAAVMTRLGFAHLVMQEDFADARRIGPYISDTAFAERILSEVEARTGPAFVFGVSMENHGPWKPGRLAGIDDPLDQYLHHVQHTGRAIEMLIDGLKDRRATLCVYGDHPPSLPANRPGAAQPRTDYAVFRFGRETGPARRVDLPADGLGRLLRQELAPATDADDGPPRS